MSVIITTLERCLTSLSPHWNAVSRHYHHTGTLSHVIITTLEPAALSHVIITTLEPAQLSHVIITTLEPAQLSHVIVSVMASLRARQTAEHIFSLFR